MEPIWSSYAVSDYWSGRVSYRDVLVAKRRKLGIQSNDRVDLWCHHYPVYGHGIQHGDATNPDGRRRHG